MKDSVTSYISQLIVVTSCFLFFTINTLSAQDMGKTPEPFIGEDSKSTLKISYQDISQILDLSVFDVGKSFRQKAKSVKASIGTRLKSSRNIYTALEANRFYFSVYKDQTYMDQLLTIQTSLLTVPDEIALNLFNKQEQLAYWLNLYNVTLLIEVIKISPRSSLGSFLYGESAILDKKLLNVAGIQLSLNDIQYNIVYPKFPKTLSVMYGFYQGIIGGPNIRTSAYTGALVYQQLDENAEEFINSNRGTFKGSSDYMRVSSLYQRNHMLFPNYNIDLKKHLMDFTVGEYEDYLKNAKYFKANIKDMHLANMRAGTRDYGGSSATNSAALLDSAERTGSKDPSIAGVAAVNPGQIAESMSAQTVNYGNYSPDMIRMLAKLKTNSRIREGTVSVKRDNK
ncbi:MAG: DUF547 domain-containing protein [Kangiellaceae bacterium]|nr:DUF547 domain-containing protein [Kangiellaceae bacterium]